MRISSPRSRRRRQRAVGATGAGTALLSSALLALSALPASAEPTSGVDASLYRPAFDSNGVFSVESATALPKHDLSIKLGVSYAQQPLSIPVPGIGGGAGADSVLDFALIANFTIAMAFTDRLTVGIDAGVYRTGTDAGYGKRGTYSNDGLTALPTGLLSLRPISNFDPSGSAQDEQLSGPVDARAGAKYTFYKSDSLRMAALATVSAPFGDDELLLGDQNLVFEPKLAIDYLLNDNGSSRIILNVGARIRERTVLEGYDTDLVLGLSMDDAQALLDVGSEALVAVGINYELLPQLVVGAEATYFEPLPSSMSYGSCRLNSGARCSTLKKADYFGGADEGDRAAYAMGGIQYRATADLSLALVAGAGITGARSESFRMMTGIIWQPTPAGTRVIGRGDSDGDGIPDATDICSDEPEDKDGYQDEDGCPDLDNDGDGIIDASDACPDDPEDKDGYQDSDGCPERDNDDDGVPDVTDRCPNDKEDIDGYDDDDGCPDEDNDGDGFPDAKDRCPNEAETINGIDDTDGCPDERTGGPIWDADRINLQGAKVAFAGARSSKLTAASRRLLEQVARLMKSKSGRIVRIESHAALSTQSSGKRAIAKAKRRDKQLTDRRARAVFNYLVSKGVVAQQLRRDSLGSTRPLQKPAFDPINDRIEFIRQ